MMIPPMARATHTQMLKLTHNLRGLLWRRERDPNVDTIKACQRMKHPTLTWLNESPPAPAHVVSVVKTTRGEAAVEKVWRVMEP